MTTTGNQDNGTKKHKRGSYEFRENDSGNVQSTPARS